MLKNVRLVFGSDKSSMSGNMSLQLRLNLNLIADFKLTLV